MTRSARHCLAATLASAAFMASLAIAHAAPIGKNCKPAPSAVSFKASTFASSTTSTTFVGIPETNVSFTQGAAGCVIVIFSGVSGNATTVMYVQAVIGGVTGLPDGNRWSGGDDLNGIVNRMHSGTYVFPNIPPGAHQLRMQYRVSADTGGFSGHNVIVYYVP